MAAPKTMSGARAKVAIVDPSTGRARVVGIFSSCSYGLTYDVQPVFILGSYGPVELEYTAQEAVPITATGWRSVGHGPHREVLVPRLQDLLTHEYIEMTVIDRQTEATNPVQARIAKFRRVRPTGYSTTINARQLQEMTVTFMGIMVDDEDVNNSESPGAAQLP